MGCGPIDIGSGAHVRRETCQLTDEVGNLHKQGSNSAAILLRCMSRLRVLLGSAIRAALEPLIPIKTQSGHESASLCREYLLGARRRGDDVAQTKIVLSDNVRVQRLSRRLGIRLVGGARDVYADGTRRTFLIDSKT